MSMSQLLFSFEGRIGRAPYWYFFLAVMILCGILGAVVGVSAVTAMQGGAQAGGGSAVGGLLCMVVGLALLWPALAIHAKRWHDVDKSAWWILIGLVPVVGGIIAFVFNGFIAGTPGPNKFGNPPA